MSAYSDAIVQMRKEALLVLGYDPDHVGEIKSTEGEFLHIAGQSIAYDREACVGRILLRHLNQIERAKK